MNSTVSPLCSDGILLHSMVVRVAGVRALNRLYAYKCLLDRAESAAAAITFLAQFKTVPSRARISGVEATLPGQSISYIFI